MRVKLRRPFYDGERLYPEGEHEIPGLTQAPQSALDWSHTPVQVPDLFPQTMSEMPVDPVVDPETRVLSGPSVRKRG